MSVSQFHNPGPQGQKQTCVSDISVVRQTHKQLITLAYRMLGNIEDARDCVQDVYMRWWASRQNQRGAAHTLPWLLRALVNRCIDHLRKRKILRFFHFDQFKQESLPASSIDGAARNELQLVLSKQVDRLKPRQKATFILRDVEGYSVAETAKILACTESSVLTNLHLARKNLRNWLKPYLQE